MYPIDIFTCMRDKCILMFPAALLVIAKHKQN